MGEILFDMKNDSRVVSMDRSQTLFEEWNTTVARAVTCLNSTEFPAALVAALAGLARFESVMIMLEQKGRAPILLYDQGIPLEKRDAVVGRYLSRGYMLDPFCLAVSSGLQEGFYHLSEIAPDDFVHSEYYETYFVKSGSVEDCYYIADIDNDRKLSISLLYPGLRNDRYTQQELARLRAAEPLVRSLALKHWADLTPESVEPDPATQSLELQLRSAFMNFGRSCLTERELEITHLILRGHSSKSAARALDISPDTVREHRKNLYRKLNINSQSELFSLFIDAVSQYSEGDSEDPLENLLNSGDT